MSAYIVTQDHIRYLIESALALSRRKHFRAFRWWYGDKWLGMTREDALKVGQMLWDENVARVSHRYSEEGQEHVFSYEPQGPYYDWNMAQIFKACDCYVYQSCEHPEWESSSAHAFIQSLRDDAWHHLDSYEEAEWGAPKEPERRPNS